MLSHDVERFVSLKRAAGYKFNGQDKTLRDFAEFATASGDQFVRAGRVYDWAICASTPYQRRERLLTVRRFALTMRAETSCHEVPAADAIGPWSKVRKSPYIYTPNEIARLIDAAANMSSVRPFRPLMYAALFGLLAATGLRISEALALQIQDATDDGLIINETKFRKSRLVPLHETTRQALGIYLSSRRKVGALTDDLFVSRFGKAPSYTMVRQVFSTLVRSVGLRTEPGRLGPRMHDLRHTFAVRSLEQCPSDREAVSRHILALGTYLGHAHLESTYWYLEATPTLLAHIAKADEAWYLRGAP
jgi:integrase